MTCPHLYRKRAGIGSKYAFFKGLCLQLACFLKIILLGRFFEVGGKTNV
jgi:hypothetical protein